MVETFRVRVIRGRSCFDYYGTVLRDRAAARAAAGRGLRLGRAEVTGTVSDVQSNLKTGSEGAREVNVMVVCQD